jgi:hypothetical protein
MLDWYRAWVYDFNRWGFRVAWANLRFKLGYRVGGFTSAKRK